MTIHKKDIKINRKSKEKKPFLKKKKKSKKQKSKKLLLKKYSISLCLEASWINISVWKNILCHYEHEPGVQAWGGAQCLSKQCSLCWKQLQVGKTNLKEIPKVVLTCFADMLLALSLWFPYVLKSIKKGIYALSWQNAFSSILILL